jgi:pimeloyl-ACP methyl ester carboxylesterase
VQAAIEKYDPKYIIGHSFGGMALLYNDYKYANPGVEKMITLGSPSELSDFMAQYKSMLGLSTNFMDAIETYFIETFDMRFADFSSSKFARKVTKKGLLIHDEFDKVAPKWSSEQVHANWKNSTLIKTKGLGHSLHQDGVRDQIVNFLKS